jgi:hypothetical protein
VSDKDPSCRSAARYFRLGANTLTAGSSHVISVNVTGPGGLSTTASSTVTVLRTPLVAAIQGGSTLVTGGGRPITLDARPSHDPDVGPSSWATLNYSWACIQGGDSYGASCGRALPADARILVGPLSPRTYLFTLTVTGTGGRVASAGRTVVVKAGSPSPPVVSIRVPTGNASRVHPGEKLSLSALVTANASTPAAYNITLTWSLSSGSLTGGSSLGAAALTTLTSSFVRQGLASVPTGLVLRGGALVRSSSYILRLTASQTGAGSALAEVSECRLEHHAFPDLRMPSMAQKDHR